MRGRCAVVYPLAAEPLAWGPVSALTPLKTP